MCSPVVPPVVTRSSLDFLMFPATKLWTFFFTSNFVVNGRARRSEASLMSSGEIPLSSKTRR